MSSQLDPNKLVVTPHASGIARLVFSPDGSFLYTSGAEGYMRVFDGRTDEEEPFDVKLLEYHEEPITSLSATNDLLCSACESGKVVLHRAIKDGSGGMELEGLVTRTGLPARMARFNPKGLKIAVASDELIVKVISVQDTTDVQLLTGHKKPVRDVMWSPDGQLLLTTDTDGQVRIWEFARSEPTCIHVMDELVPAEDVESDYPVSIVWHPSSKYFVVATKTNEIAVISRDGWSKTGTFSSDDGNGHTSKISSLAFSSNGLYLASAGTEGKIIVWNTSTRVYVNHTTHSSALITSMAFHPSKGSNILAYIDFSGQLTRWTAPIPLGKGLPFPGGPSATEAALDEFDAELEGDWLDDDLGNGFPAASQDEKGRGMTFEEAEEVAEDEERDDEEDKRIRRQVAVSSRKVAEWDNGFDLKRTTTATSGKPQETFQPGATPFKESKRYLAFNMLGLIHVVEREEHNIVTIEFHDRGAHPGFHFTDNFKYTLGSLGELGSVFACRSSGDEPSLIYYRPYDSWTNVQDWQYKLPRPENAIAVAVGGIVQDLDDDDLAITGTGTVLVATDRGYVRFFTGSGLQKYVWNLGEEVVALVAGKDWAMVVWRASGVVDRRQNLEYTIIDTDTFEIVQQGRMPLRRGVTLKWIGFTDDHIPAMYDSDGLLSVLDRSRRPRQARWVPALDMHSLARREGKQESYWPIGVTQRHVHTIILKGAETYPHFPTPLFQEIDLQFPLLRQDVQQGQLEEQYLRETIFVSHRRDGADPDDYSLKSQLAREELETDKHLLKTIQTSCKAEKLQAALDAALMLTQPASIDAALKIAAFFHLPALEERIEKVREAKTGIRALDDENKRKAKWSHLVDDRTIVAPPTGGRRGDSGANMFSVGLSSYNPRKAPPSAYDRPSRPSASFSIKSQRMEKLDSGFASDNADPDESMDYEQEEIDTQEPAPKRARSSSRSDHEFQDFVEEPEEMAQPPPKKALNPFSKRPATTKPPAPAKTNPFASQKGSAKAGDLHRTGSFFTRVEGKEPPKPKHKPVTKAVAAPPPKPKGKAGTQTTLFGLPPVDSATLENKATKGKKRKSIGDVEDEGAEPVATPESDKSILDDAFKSRQSDGQGGPVRDLPRFEGDEMEETQTEESQIESQPALQKSGSSLEAVQEIIEGEEDTQMEETQSASPEVPSKVAKAAVPVLDGISKLQQWKNTAVEAA